MAKIPRLGGGNQISGPGKVASRSVEGAGIEGRAIANLGGQALGFAKELDRRREKAEVDNFRDTNTMDYYLEADSLIANSKKDPQFAENANGYSDHVRKGLDEIKSRILAKQPSSAAGNAFADSIQRYEVNNTVQSQAFERKAINTQYRNNRVESGNKLKFQGYMNPDPIENARRVEEHLSDTKSAVGNEISQEEFQILSDDLKSGMLDSNVEGFIEMASEEPDFSKKQSIFESARQLVENDSALYGAIKTPEQKAKVLKHINKRQVENFNLEVRQQDQQRRLDKLDFEETEKGHLNDLITGSLEGQDVEDSARALLKNKEISIKSFRMIRDQFADEDEKDKSSSTKLNLMFSLSNGTNPAAVRERLQKSVMEGSISDKDAIQVLSSIGSADKKSGREKSAIKNANGLLKSAIVIPAAFGLPAKGGREFAEAMIERDELINQGVEPVKATRAIIRKYKGDIAALPPLPMGMKEKPSASQDAASYVREQMGIIKQRLETGSITEDEALKEGSNIQERDKAFATQDFHIVDDV